MHQSANDRAGISAAGKIEGDVRFNGHPKEQETFARVSGYVERFDTHTAAATVYEALMFSGTLRNGIEVDVATTKTFVDQVYLQVFPRLGLTVQIAFCICGICAICAICAMLCKEDTYNHLTDI